MPTYQDLINELSAEINAATDAGQHIIVAEKYVKLSELYMELGFDAVEKMNFSESYQCFDLARQAADLFKKNFEAAPEQEQNAELSNQNDQNLYTSLGFANFSLGQLNNTSRNPGVAVAYFQQAVTDFENLSRVSANKFWIAFSKYCGAFKLYAEGMEDFARASFNNAKLKLQRATIAMGNVIEKELPLAKDGFPGGEKAYEDSVKKFKADHQTIRSIYYLSDAKQQFNTRHFKTAVDKFSLVANEFDISIKNYSEHLNEALKNITLGEYHNYNGWRFLSQAEAFREDEQWNDSLKLYDEVRVEWEKAAGFYLQSEMQQGLALQEAISNASLSLDVYQRVCENEKELKTRISELEEEIDDLNTNLRSALKSAGVTINNNNELTATIEQNVQFVQHIENNAREQVKELIELLKTTDLSEADKKNLQAKGEEVIKSPEKGTKFLDKVKDFTADLGAIVENVSKIAAPLIPGFKLLKFLF